jgi:hypothetical protein
MNRNTTARFRRERERERLNARRVERRRSWYGTLHRHTPP